MIALAALAFLQSVAFCVVSRARNRNHMGFHAAAAVASNVVWFLTFRILVTEEMGLALLLPYTAGTVIGSLSGAWISQRIEQAIGATT